MPDSPGPFRDGLVHVLAERCSTCVFRAGNLMQLNAGRLKELVTANAEAESALTCHETLPGWGDAEPAVCRGYFDTHPTLPLRLAEAINVIAYDPPPAPSGKR